jgi:hypothetical protein
MEDIQKEVFDINKMPEEFKNDSFKQESWTNDEKGRIEQEYQDKLAGKTEKVEKQVEEQEKQVTPFNFEEDEDFKGYGIKSVDDIKTQLKAAKEGGASKEEIAAIKLELEDTKSKLEAKPKTFFNNKELAKLDKLSKENPEAYERLARLRWGNMDSMNILKEKFIKENPEYKDSDIVEDMINRKYGLNKKYDLEDPDEAKEYKMAKAEFDISAKAARKELLSELDNTEVAETEFVDEKKLKEDATKKKTELRTKWSEFASGIEKEFQKYKIQIPQKDERGNIIKGKFIDFTEHVIPEDIRKMCANYAHEYVVERGLEPSKETMQEASIDMLKTYVFSNLPYIIDTAIEKRASMEVEEFHKLYNNPSGGKKDVKPAGNKSQSETERKKAEEDYIAGR